MCCAARENYPERLEGEARRDSDANLARIIVLVIYMLQDLRRSCSLFRPEEIAEIERMVNEERTPQEIARSLGLAHSSFRAKLADSGYRIIIKRELQRIVPIPPAVNPGASGSREGPGESGDRRNAE